MAKEKNIKMSCEQDNSIGQFGGWCVKVQLENSALIYCGVLIHDAREKKFLFSRGHSADYNIFAGKSYHDAVMFAVDDLLELARGGRS